MDKILNASDNDYCDKGSIPARSDLTLFGCRLFEVFVKKPAPQVSCRNTKNSLETKVKWIVLGYVKLFLQFT